MNYLGIDSGLTKGDLETLDYEEACIGDVDLLRACALEINRSNDGGSNNVSIGMAAHSANLSPATTYTLQKRPDSLNEILAHKDRAERVMKEVKEVNEAKKKESDNCSQW